MAKVGTSKRVADGDLTAIEVKVLPSQAEAFALPQAHEQRHRPASVGIATSSSGQNGSHLLQGEGRLYRNQSLRKSNEFGYVMFDSTTLYCRLEDGTQDCMNAPNR